MPEERLEARASQDLDLDQDLFDFGETTDAAWDEQEEADLDEIFATFEADEEARREAAAARAEELFGEEDPDELPAPEDFAGLNPEPPPAIPRPVAEERDTAPPLTPPTVEDTAPAPPPPVAPDPAPQAPPARPAPAAPEAQAAPPPAAPYGVPVPPPQHVYYQTAPPAQPAAAAPAGPFGLSRGLRVAAWILIAITSINALVALVALKSTGDLRRSVKDVGEQVTQTATDLIRENLRTPQELAPARSSGEPLSAPNPENHPTFELAREEIQRGEYARARQRLYGLLAIVDRLDPLVREQVEARANYLLARAIHLQTVDEWEENR